VVKKTNNINMKIYHNPRCSKSRETLSILNKKNVKVDIIEYLKTPLKKVDIQNIITMLGTSAFNLIRKQEKVFKERYKGKNLSEAEWTTVLHQNPILIERPIVVKDNIAIIGRPPINVLFLLK